MEHEGEQQAERKCGASQGWKKLEQPLLDHGFGNDCRNKTLCKGTMLPAQWHTAERKANEITTPHKPSGVGEQLFTGGEGVCRLNFYFC
jgi:hypothetical protein